MNRKDVEKFLTLRSKLLEELNEVEKELDQLNDRAEVLDVRHAELTNILDGSIGDVESLPQEMAQEPSEITDKGTIDVTVARFLADNPGSSFGEIRDGLPQLAPDVARKVHLSLKRLKNHNAIVRQGTTANSTWYLA